METPLLFYLALFVIAALYASVGHGGASGYLALMALFGMAPDMMKASALTLNLFVSAIAFYAYHKKGFFNLHRLLPFVAGSLPMAYVGARLPVDPLWYKAILGIFLLIAVGRMIIQPSERSHMLVPFSPWKAILTGAFLGFFSGMIGIGGGIILSPLLLLLGWAHIKEAAALSAAFIFLNSAAGLAGLASTGYAVDGSLILWIVVGIAGGLAGAHLGAARLSFTGVRLLLMAVLLTASIKLMIPVLISL